MDPEYLEKLLGPGRKRFKSIEISDSGEARITVLVGDREVTIEGPITKVEGVPSEAVLWRDSTWLEREFRTHGSLRAAARAHGLPDETAYRMTQYARRKLNWRISEGNELKRWEFVARYFAETDPKARPTLTAVFEALDTSLGNASVWKKEVLAGKIFGARFTYERLVEVQTQTRADTRYVYFPGSKLKLEDFSLAQLTGWPSLPPGLLSDLLPTLDGLSTQTVKLEGRKLYLELEHAGTPLHFEVTLMEPASLDAEATLEAVAVVEENSVDRGVRRYTFRVGERRVEVRGRLTCVHQASAKGTYKVRTR